jgi:putative DNA primase/helicase
VPVATQVDHLSIAEEVGNIYDFAAMRDTGKVYVYRKGVYRQGGEAIIQEEAKNLLGGDFTSHKVNEILNWIRYSSYVDRPDFDRDRNIINVKNGLLNIETLELTEHTSQYLSVVQLPVFYHPDSKCSRIEQFLSEVVNEEDIPVIEELLGFCLLTEYRFHKAFMFQGAGRNGKTTLLNLLQRFLGESNCSNVALTELSDNRFASAQLFGKLANVFADLPAEALKTTGIFKALVGGDRINAEQKFQAPFEFTNYAKLIFSCNYVPMTYDLSNAFFSRWIIIRFPNTFEGDAANPNLIDELTTEEELAGLLNLALKGRRRLLENGRFSYNKTTEDIQEEYERLSNPVAAFIADMCEEDPEEYAVKDELYNAFKSYCKANGYPVFSEKKFTELLKKQTSVSDYRPVVEGERKRAWQGIKLLPPPVSLPSSLSPEYVQDVHDVQVFGDCKAISSISKEKVGKKVDMLDMVDGEQQIGGTEL